jgi:hypothetical protein
MKGLVTQEYQAIFSPNVPYLAPNSLQRKVIVLIPTNTDAINFATGTLAVVHKPDVIGLYPTLYGNIIADFLTLVQAS